MNNLLAKAIKSITMTEKKQNSFTSHQNEIVVLLEASLAYLLVVLLCVTLE